MADLKLREIQHYRFAVLATDVVLFTIRDGVLLVRLTPVNRPPHFKNAKGFPGGLVRPSETADAAATRIIGDKALIEPRKVHLEQLYTFSRVDRDPRGRVVAVGYLGLVAWERLSAAEQADTDQASWTPSKQATHLAYDHDEILLTARSRFRSRITYTTLVSKLMPAEFTLSELQGMYARILEHTLDKRNFRKKIQRLGIIKPLPRKQTRGKARPAQLYRFASSKVREIDVL